MKHKVFPLGTKIGFGENHRFSSYYRQVKNHNFYLFSAAVSNYALNSSKATTAKMKIVTDWINSRKSLDVQEEPGLTVTDNVGRMLSGSFRVVYHDINQVVNRKYVKCLGGIINYLPPIDGSASTEESIDIILNILGKARQRKRFQSG